MLTSAIFTGRVHILHRCFDPQVSDFLMRVKSGRFPSIEKDMKMVLAHCGSLCLDPASLLQVRCMLAHPTAACGRWILWPPCDV